MLKSRAERIAFGLTVVVLGLLAASMVLGVMRYRQTGKRSTASAGSAAEQGIRRHRMMQAGAPAGARAKQPPERPPAVPATPPVAASVDVPSAPVTPRKPAAPVSNVVTLKLTAARGECWVEVHKGSEDGQRVYSGILAVNQAQTFRGKRFWIRFGAPENIDATVDGKHAAVPADTLNVVVTRRGVAAASESAAA